MPHTYHLDDPKEGRFDPTESLQYAGLLGNKVPGDIQYREGGALAYFAPDEPPWDVAYVELLNRDGTPIEDAVSYSYGEERRSYDERITWIDSLLTRLEKAVEMGLFNDAPDQFVVLATYLLAIKFNLSSLQRGGRGVSSPSEQVEKLLGMQRANVDKKVVAGVARMTIRKKSEIIEIKKALSPYRSHRNT